jgi:hypothetical protein
MANGSGLNRAGREATYLFDDSDGVKSAPAGTGGF